jgi:N-methylhydantoinase A/oxoprolinase/acetone carboxylase beta subunit
MRQIRIGIDVGGTFTHAVAIDVQHLNLVTQTKTLTTHQGEQGVAHGIVTALLKVLQKGRIRPEEITLVAHSTTQATNALLEGDVAKVGVVGMGTGLKVFRIQQQTEVDEIELAPGRVLKTCYRFLNIRKNFSEETIRQAIRELRDEGAQAIVAAEAFSVDHPDREHQVVALARDMGLPATASQDVSKLYGLHIRTRTAVINASMLPVMIATAEMTERSVRETGIQAPLMVMRSDGGVMDIKGMRERPILTLYSGPAAGVAAALMYARVAEGIFVEVGGTSTDISAIHRGEVMLRTAFVGTHKLYTKTLDVRTVAAAGGSMPRVRQGEVVAVGPRSAHIAGMPYEAFSQIQDIQKSEPVYGSPIPGDPRDYVYLQNKDHCFALTVTGAANFLGLIPEHDYARGGERNVAVAFEKLGKLLQTNARTAAAAILDKCCGKVVEVIRSLVKDYRLNPDLLRLIGGGGGASTILPYTSVLVQMPFELARNSAVISAIGVALSMVRETVERNLVDPSSEELLRVRQEAEEAVIRMGAAPDTVEAKIEVDHFHQRVVATAIGSTDVRLIDKIGRPLTASKRIDIAATALSASENNLTVLANTGFFTVYASPKVTARFFGLIKEKSRPVVVVDQHGIVRLNFQQVEMAEATAAEGTDKLRSFVDLHTHYGDGGPQIPGIHLAIGPRLVDFSGLMTAQQVVSMGELELSKFTPESPVLLMADLKN